MTFIGICVTITVIMPKIKFTIITLFPEALQPYLDSSMLFKAQKQGIIEIDYVNLRDFGLGPHKSVDDTPYGGGDGMLLRCEPVFAAIESIKQNSPEAEVILPTPIGVTWNQALARQFAGIETSDSAENLADMARERSLAHTDDAVRAGQYSTVRPSAASRQNSKILSTRGEEEAASAHNDGPEERRVVQENIDQMLTGSQQLRHCIILCPHYEGYDERIMTIVDHPISLGNYVLTGGELPALIIIDSVTRLLPGVLGGETSATIESFSCGDNLEYPQYTKPADFRGLKVPEVLMSGNHGAIAKWRAEHSNKQIKS